MRFGAFMPRWWSSQPVGFSYTCASLVLGPMLLAAAGLKGWELATDTVPGTDLLNTRGFLIAIVLLEIGFGLWLLTGLFPRGTRLATIALFALFFQVSLYQGVTGESSCGCFGRHSVSPWLVLPFDFAAILALIIVHPRENASFQMWRLRGWAVCYGLLGFPALASMVNYSATGVIAELRTDSRLSATVALDLTSPTNTDLIQALRQATGLGFTVARAVDAKPVDFGRMRVRSAPVSSVMEMIAQKQSVAARWEKTEYGFHLRAVAPWGGRAMPWLISALLGFAIVVGIGIRRLRRRADSERSPTSVRSTVSAS